MTDRPYCSLSTLIDSNNVEDDLICGICMDLMIHPIQCHGGHSWCLDCIKNNNRTKCPICPESIDIDDPTVNWAIKNIIESKQCKCPIKNCTWTNSLGLLKLHWEKCSKVIWLLTDSEDEKEDFHYKTGDLSSPDPTEVMRMVEMNDNNNLEDNNDDYLNSSEESDYEQRDQKSQMSKKRSEKSKEQAKKRHKEIRNCPVCVKKLTYGGLTSHKRSLGHNKALMERYTTLKCSSLEEFQRLTEGYRNFTEFYSSKYDSSFKDFVKQIEYSKI